MDFFHRNILLLWCCFDSFGAMKTFLTLFLSFLVLTGCQKSTDAPVEGLTDEELILEIEMLLEDELRIEDEMFEMELSQIHMEEDVSSESEDRELDKEIEEGKIIEKEFETLLDLEF